MYNDITSESSDEESFKRILQAAQDGSRDAQFDLGVCYELGRGVERDAAEAVKWYREVLEQGHAAAQFFLGRCYKNGAGVERDAAEAAELF